MYVHVHILTLESPNPFELSFMSGMTACDVRRHW